jgi:hypothetical protein
MERHVSRGKWSLNAQAKGWSSSWRQSKQHCRNVSMMNPWNPNCPVHRKDVNTFDDARFEKGLISLCTPRRRTGLVVLAAAHQSAEGNLEKGIHQSAYQKKRKGTLTMN